MRTEHSTLGLCALPALLSLLACGAADAADRTGIAFTHGDWEVACDNTRTCRAAGYHRDGEDGAAQPVSVLLTRKAGPHAPVKAELQVGTEDDEAATKAARTLTMTIDGRAVGKVVVPKGATTADLPPDQTAALLAALPRHSRIAWSNGQQQWQLSDEGAAAVLLKMDDAQGRIGTPGALVRKGANSEDGVPPPVSAPVVQRAAVPAAGADAVRLPRAELAALQRALFGKRNTCDAAEDPAAKPPDIVLHRLSATRLLASAQCWIAAYNTGDGYWIVNAGAPFAPQKVTDSGTDYGDGKISSAQKGRGVGDCGSFDEWTWDGQRFVHTGAGTSGMCKGFAGGAWSLPTLVTTVR